MSAAYENLPVYKQALDLTVYFETVVRHFERYHKYTIGAELRNKCRSILMLITKANKKIDRKMYLEMAVRRLEELKILIRIAKEINAFRSLRSFEYAIKKTVDVAKQCEGWLRCQNSSSQKP
jgi:four helix bundle protein